MDTIPKHIGPLKLNAISVRNVVCSVALNPATKTPGMSRKT